MIQIKTVLVQDHVYSSYLHFASANVGNQPSQNDSACTLVYNQEYESILFHGMRFAMPIHIRSVLVFFMGIRTFKYVKT
ncbi:unnamed protein product (macronuclear) [Paramecium tetraurelia]|uniref:Uncharacterized protein n=1 Tax=Paramecium tetraurelia TaxID=5888 RepID=A0E468_PARTE|nr:uncharacterized protein GSPATT00023259001 [Paramecium tetraurelia]CAK90085.1 unnamed protein product [Paramecium tetraurelia]|eukprot:XP_001457482.1 hypothetical protein (macronuclear) [Paramecium tetraurelia strain d4-2]